MVGRAAATIAATSSVGRKVLRTKPSAPSVQRGDLQCVRPAHGTGCGRPGPRARSRAMNAIPPSTSGRRGSTMTTSGRSLDREVERRPRAARPCHDHDPVADRQQPRQALADTVVRVDDEHAKPAAVDRVRDRACGDGGAAARTRGTDLRRCPVSAERRVRLRHPSRIEVDSTGNGRSSGGALRRISTITSAGTTTSIVVPASRSARAREAWPRCGRPGRACRRGPGGRPGPRPDRSPCRRR